MNNVLKVLCIVVLMAGFTTCKTTKVETTQPVANTQTFGITEKYWKLIEINGKQVVMDETMRREPHMILKDEDHRMSGTGGCNMFTGSYTIEAPDRIKFSPLASTMMACINMEIESEMLKMFEMVDNYTLSTDGRYLSLNRARMAPLARFEALYMK